MSLNISQQTEQAINEIAASKNVSVETLLSAFVEQEKFSQGHDREDAARKNRYQAQENEMLDWLNDMSSDEEE